jgi:hypothetical protein
MTRVPPAFDIEREMWIPATKWLAGQGLAHKREFRMPWGICDLVGVEWSNYRVAERMLKRQKAPIGPPGRVALLRMVPNEESGRSISIDELSARSSQPVQHVERELKSLIRGNFVKANEDGSLTSTVSWTPLHSRIVAIELKLDRIEEAINQARSHLAFATESFVGFPQAVAERIVSSHHADILKHAGVGLLSVTKACTVVLTRSTVSSPVPTDDVLQMHCIERFWPQVTSRVA